MGLAEACGQRAVRVGLLPPADPDVRQDGARHRRRACSPDALDKAKATKGVTTDVDLDVDGPAAAWCSTFKDIVREQSGREFPQHPREQLDLAIRAVFDSWNTDRARLYRRRERIPHDLGTAVNVCTMVFGNLGETSGTGVAFTRDPSTGAPGRVRRLPGQRAGRGRRRRYPQHAVAGRPQGPRPRVAHRADDGHAPAGDALPRPVRHRVHHRARQAVDAADPRRQAHRGGGVPDRHASSSTST